MKKQIILIMILFTLLLAHTCWAGESTANMTVSANVVHDCTVTANGLAFTDYSGAADVTAESTFEVNCSPTLPYTIDLDQGENCTSAGRQLQLAVTPNYIQYRLYSDASYSTLWGTYFTGGESVSGTGSGSVQTYTVYGLILAGQYPDAGAYEDTITVTVTW